MARPARPGGSRRAVGSAPGSFVARARPDRRAPRRVRSGATAADHPRNCSIDEMTQGIAESRPTGVKLGVPYLEYMKAEALLELGHRSEAASLLDELLLRTEKTGITTELLRLRGVLHRHDGAIDLAETCFRQSLELAEDQGARLFQLRTATDLARLYLDQGEPAKARAVLEPIYSSFSEGFDAADLVAAKSVLDW
jgi:tetratricopeptide (TPR) repeat protein